MNTLKTRQVSPWSVLSVTTMGTFLASIQSSALVLTLPDVMVGLKTDFSTILWVLLGYLLMSTALVPLIGRLSDLYGRKTFYLIGFLIFTLASLGAGFAQASWQGWDLVIWRLVQGLGAALLFANSTALVTDAFGKNKTGTALGINQIASAAGFVLGPLVGGLLTGFSWRWVFWFNVPLGLMGTLWALRTLPRNGGEREEGRFDLKGTLLFLVGLTSLLSGISLLAVPGFSLGAVAVTLSLGVAGLLLFVMSERRSAHPFLHLELFTDSRLSLPNLTAGLNGLARGAMLFLLTFYLQGTLGLDPLSAGLATAPFGLAMLVTGPWAGSLSDKGHPGLWSTGGLILASLGLLGLSFVGVHTPYWLLALEMVLMGAGSGFFNSPNVKLIMNRVSSHHRGMASATRILVVNTGQMLALAVIFPFVLARIPQDLMARIFLYGGGLTGHPAVAEGMLQGIRTAFFASFILTVLAALISGLTYHRSRKPRPEEVPLT
ncbi:MAG: MFS transporter [Spirochaetales bacterium]|nr:MFS transporter [Spirochaetales bacterium]